MATSSLDRVDDEEGATRALEKPEPRRSTFSVLRDAVLSGTRIVEDSTELIGASVREELAHFRVDLARQALSVIAITVGGGLLTAGLAMFLNELVNSWPLTLVLFGALYVGIAVLLQLKSGGESS